MARRDDREYREYLREEQRRQPGCPAREVVLDQPIQATSSPARMTTDNAELSAFAGPFLRKSSLRVFCDVCVDRRDQ